MSKLNTALESTLTFVTQYPARSRCRYQLLNKTDRQLEDIGVSREKLEAGVSAWPWTVIESELHSTSTATILQPVAERQSVDSSAWQDSARTQTTQPDAVDMEQPIEESSEQFARAA